MEPSSASAPGKSGEGAEHKEAPIERGERAGRDEEDSAAAAGAEGEFLADSLSLQEGQTQPPPVAGVGAAEGEAKQGEAGQGSAGRHGQSGAPAGEDAS